MSEKWLISVPNTNTKGGVLSELAAASTGLAIVHPFPIPPLKVGTLDSLIALSEEAGKSDPLVGGIAVKILKTYYELWKTEAQETQAAKTAQAGSSSSSSSQAAAEQAPELRIDGKSVQDYVAQWRWNEVRYPGRSPLPTLMGIIIKDSTKSDEALKKQVAEYNEVRTSYTAIERKDQGTLLVKPLGPYVKQQPIETSALTTLMIVIPKNKYDEFKSTYETLEIEAAAREKEDAIKRQKEAEERARKEEERKQQAEEKELEANKSKSAAQLAHEAQKKAEKEAEKEKEAEAAKVAAEMEDQATKEKREQARKEHEEEEKRKNKKLPPGCNAVVPRSLKELCNEPADEFALVSVVVLKQGAEHYKNLCREKRYTVRPFKFDPEEDKLERERKAELAKKKKNLWNFLIRWCTTTYTEVFTAWIHLKAIRLYVESVLRYGLPYNSQAMILEPVKGRDKQLREVLKNLYSRLAGNNANLTTALDPNEPDLSGLGSDFYPYVYLPLVLTD